MSKKKYTLLKDDFIKLKNGTKLYRIMALRDILSDRLIVVSGQKGGYIESERNLSHNGDAWICDGCIVRDSAFVCMDALIKGKSEIWGEAYVSGKVTISHSLVRDNIVVSDDCSLDNCVLSGEKHILGIRSYEGVQTGDVSSCIDESVLCGTGLEAEAMAR